MYSQAKQAVSDLSEAAEDTRKMYKKAIKRAPRMRKEITVRSTYFSCTSNRHPCAESLFKLDIDCNLLKFILFIFIGMCVLSLVCMRSRRKR